MNSQSSSALLVLFLWLFSLASSFADPLPPVDEDLKEPIFPISERLLAIRIMSTIAEYSKAAPDRKLEIEGGAKDKFLSYWVMTTIFGEKRSEVVEKRIFKFAKILLRSSSFIDFTMKPVAYYNPKGEFRGGGVCLPYERWIREAMGCHCRA